MKKYIDISRKWLSISEAAKYLGVSKDTLRRWEKKGKLTSRRTIGRHRRYSKKQLENILRQPIEQVFEKKTQTITKTPHTSYASKTPTTTSKKTISRLAIKKPKISNNLITISLVVMISILIIASIYLLQIVKNGNQPQTPLSPVPLTYNLFSTQGKTNL